MVFQILAEKFLFALPASCLVIAMAAVPSSAAVIATGDITVLGTPPSSVIPGAIEDDETTIFFEEQIDFTLSEDIRVDITVPGTYDDTNEPDARSGSILAGTTINSYLLHADPVGVRPVGDDINYTGSLTFEDEEILGLIVYGETLFLSDDELGAPGTLYPPASGDRRSRGLTFEFDEVPRDILTFSADRQTVSFDLLSAPDVDQIRIITADDVDVIEVPEPASMLGILAVSAIAGVSRARRNQKQSF